MNDERVGKYVAPVEEAEISSRPSSESLNEKDDYVGEFDASTGSGDNFYDIFLEWGRNHYWIFNGLVEH